MSNETAEPKIRSDVAPTPNPQGWYAFGVAKKSARWDGEAWAGESRQDESVPEQPKWHHHFLQFLSHRWFWYMVAGSVLVLIPAAVAANTGMTRLAWFTLIGMAVFMVGAYFLVDRHEHFSQLTSRRKLIIWGVVSGVIANALAMFIEPFLEPKLGLPFAADLWLAGPIEETCKLLVPFLLLAFGSKVFKDPRAGLMLVLICGMVFGIWEAINYIGDPHGWNPLLMGIVRPTSELLHPLLTGFAAAVIWLAAWRAGRPVTLVGIGAWVLAMAVHSIHDGVAAGSSRGTRETMPTMKSATEAITLAIPTLVFALIIAVLLFLLLRHSARELVPPDSIGTNSPHWRPQIKHWGMPKAAREHAEQAPAPPT